MWHVHVFARPWASVDWISVFLFIKLNCHVNGCAKVRPSSLFLISRVLWVCAKHTDRHENVRKVVGLWLMCVNFWQLCFDSLRVVKGKKKVVDCVENFFIVNRTSCRALLNFLHSMYQIRVTMTKTSIKVINLFSFRN